MRHTIAPFRVPAVHQSMTSLVVLATILTGGCELTTEGGMNPTAPSAVGSLLMGTWVSATAQGGAGFPSASDCTELEWTITEENGSNYAGEFSATCNDGIQLDGTATGVLTGNVLDIEATGTATLPDVASCAFTLSGTAVLEDETISVNYSGDTCLGSVSGSELLQRS